MIINKVLNNNVITIIDENQKESVIMGCGIAFQKKKGDEVAKDKIQKVFVLDNKSSNDRLLTLLNDIPAECIEVAEEIINYAESQLETGLNASIYLTLTDHISFALSRHEQKLEIKNSMLWEIKRLHKREYAIGLRAVEIINERFHVTFPEDEAASIAMHILNGQLNKDMQEIVQMIKLTEEILKVVKYHFSIDFDEESLDYHRFLTHLKFFVQRLFSGNHEEDKDNDLFDLVTAKYPKGFECVQKIGKFINEKYGYELRKEEMLYLTIHISRVITKN